MAIDIACFSDADAVSADARGALDRQRQHRLFDRLDWYRLILEHCPPGGVPLIVRARDEGAAAWLFLVRNGDQAAALANWYTFETGLIEEGAATLHLAAAIARHLRQTERIAVIDLFPIPEARMTALSSAFRSAGWQGRSVAASTNWSMFVSSMDWEQFLKGRPARLRNTIRRRARNNYSIEILSYFDDDKWDIYEHIYRGSWKPEEGSPAMLRALACQQGEAGTLRLGLAFDEGKPVAAQFWLVENGAATIHKLAHVEAARGKSPGTILTAAMFRHAIEQDKVTRIDFGTGDDAYKADWMDQVNPLYRLRFYNLRKLPGIIAWVRDSLSAARQAIRRAR